MRVGILGGGRWGQALARLVMAAGHEPFIAFRDEKPPQILPSTDDPPQVSAACDLLLVATSAARVREAIRLAQPGSGNRVVVAGRGLEPETGRWLTDVVLEECDALRVGALAGPAPVDEILNGGLCAGVVASEYDEVRALAVAALHSSRYRTYESPDLVGVQLAGAMVPVLATMTGVVTNLRGSGVGMHAMAITRGLEETRRLARALGADAMTLSGLAGLGDLVAVQGSGRYSRAGAVLAGEAGDRDESSLHIARALLKLAGEHAVELPLTEALVSMYDGVSALDAVGRLMSRKAQPEAR